MKCLIRTQHWGLWAHKKFLLGPLETSVSRSWYFGWFSIDRREFDRTVCETALAEVQARLRHIEGERDV